jgi:hypothetical protein
MKIENQAQRDRQRPGNSGGAGAVERAATAGTRQRKNRSMEMTRVKTLIAGLSVAATVGGWGMMAQHDGTSATQTAVDQASVVSLVSQTTTQELPQAAATPQSAQATATTALQSSLQAIATATVEPQASSTVAIEASATATPQPTDMPQPTATPKPTSTPKAAVATTRSSK